MLVSFYFYNITLDNFKTDTCFINLSIFKILYSVFLFFESTKAYKKKEDVILPLMR